ncbi:MAG: glycosyltransferase, partial [Pseudomonadota bacterium]
LREKFGLPERFVLVSARFIEKKNIPNLIQAYSSALKRVYNGPDLVILGDGPDRETILRTIADKKLEGRVHLHGFRGYDILPSYYGLSEGLVHVSKSEQWGLVINEAMAAALPVLASNRCGAARTMIKNDVNGLLTEPDVESIAEALVKLFSLSVQKRVEIGRAAQETVFKWGPDRFGVGLRDAVQSVKGSVPSRPSILERVIFGYLSRKVISQVS